MTLIWPQGYFSDYANVAEVFASDNYLLDEDPISPQ